MKKIIIYFFSIISIFIFTSSTTKVITMAMLQGEPIPGAEIYVELEPDDEPIANTETDENGEFFISSIPGENPQINVSVTLPSSSNSSLAQQYTDLNFIDATVTIKSGMKTFTIMPAKWDIGMGKAATRLPSKTLKLTKKDTDKGITISVRTVKTQAQLKQMLQAINKRSTQ